MAQQINLTARALIKPGDTLADAGFSVVLKERPA
jgi:hypothetical protein